MADGANTLIIANSARLLGDAKLQAEHARFASAFALAVLGVEEIGKVILEIWGKLPRPYAKMMAGKARFRMVLTMQS